METKTTTTDSKKRQSLKVQSLAIPKTIPKKRQSSLLRSATMPEKPIPTQSPLIDPTTQPNRLLKADLHFPISLFTSSILPPITINQNLQKTQIHEHLLNLNALLDEDIQQQDTVLLKLFPNSPSNHSAKQTAALANQSVQQTPALAIRPLLNQARSLVLEHAFNAVESELKSTRFKKPCAISTKYFIHGMKPHPQKLYKDLIILARKLDWYKKVMNVQRKITEMESIYAKGKFDMTQRLARLNQIEQLTKELLQWNSTIHIFGQKIVLKTEAVQDLFSTIRQVAQNQQDLFKCTTNIDENQEEKEDTAKSKSLHSVRSVLQIQKEYTDERDTPYHFPAGFLKQHRAYWNKHIQPTGTLSFEQYLATHPLLVPQRVKHLMMTDTTTFSRLQSENFPLSPPPKGVKYIYDWEERKKYEVYIENGCVRKQKSYSFQFNPFAEDSDSNNDTQNNSNGDDNEDGDFSFFHQCEMISDERDHLSAEMISEMVVTGGELLDTKEMVTTPSHDRSSGGDGWSMVVYHLKYGLFVGEHTVNEFHHSTFFAGQEVTL